MASENGEAGDCKGVDTMNGIGIAENLVESILKRIDERIETAETLKKIPDFNANLAVE